MRDMDNDWQCQIVNRNATGAVAQLQGDQWTTRPEKHEASARQ